jgi:hypothetical protein
VFVLGDRLRLPQRGSLPSNSDDDARAVASWSTVGDRAQRGGYEAPLPAWEQVT